MRDTLEEIQKHRPNILNQVEAQLQQTSLATIKLETRLERLRIESEMFREDAKQQHRDVQRYGRNGMQQIKNRVFSSETTSLNEDIPTEYFQNAMKKLEERFATCTSEIQVFSQHLGLMLEDFRKDSQNQGTANYGQRTRLGIQQLVEILQEQNKAFVRIAAHVAETHEHCEKLRTRFLELFGQSSGNPFHAADREEEARERRLINKSRRLDANGQPTDASSAGQAQAASGSTALTVPGAPGAPAAPAPAAFGSLGSTTASTGGFGGFGGFGAAPAPAVAPAPAGTGGFGTFGAVPAPAPAAAPATGGFGGFGTPASTTTAPTLQRTGGSTGAAGGFGGFGGFGTTGAASTSLIPGLDLQDNSTKSKSKSKKK
jgi:hypothetical protein